MRRRVREEEHTGELNIVPYLDVVVNLVMFMLLSMTGLVSLGVLNVSAPSLAAEGAAEKPERPPLLLTVAVGRQGFHVAAAGVAGDAAAASADGTPTVPLRDGAYDYAALTEHLKRIKEQFPKETAVILSADPGVIYDVLIQTMDACREASVKGPDGRVERRPLFFDVSLSVIG
jgi:biopolymer transport protein ExbD